MDEPNQEKCVLHGIEFEAKDSRKFDSISEKLHAHLQRTLPMSTMDWLGVDGEKAMVGNKKGLARRLAGWSYAGAAVTATNSLAKLPNNYA